MPSGWFVASGLALVLVASGAACADPRKAESDDGRGDRQAEPWRDPQRREPAPAPPDMRAPSGPWAGGAAAYVQPTPPPGECQPPTPDGARGQQAAPKRC